MADEAKDACSQKTETRELENTRALLLDVLEVIRREVKVKPNLEHLERRVRRATSTAELRMVMDGLMVIARLYDRTES